MALVIIKKPLGSFGAKFECMSSDTASKSCVVCVCSVREEERENLSSSHMKLCNVLSAVDETQHDRM